MVSANPICPTQDCRSRGQRLETGRTDLLSIAVRPVGRPALHATVPGPSFACGRCGLASAEVNQWLGSHPDRTFHFTPTPAFWMNAVEGFFSKHSRSRLKHALLNPLDECIAVVEGCIEHQNATDARPFHRSRKPEELVEAWKEGHRKPQELAS